MNKNLFRRWWAYPIALIVLGVVGIAIFGIINTIINQNSNSGKQELPTQGSTINPSQTYNAGNINATMGTGSDADLEWDALYPSFASTLGTTTYSVDQSRTIAKNFCLLLSNKNWSSDDFMQFIFSFDNPREINLMLPLVVTTFCPELQSHTVDLEKNYWNTNANQNNFMIFVTISFDYPAIIQYLTQDQIVQIGKDTCLAIFNTPFDATNFLISEQNKINPSAGSISKTGPIDVTSENSPQLTNEVSKMAAISWCTDKQSALTTSIYEFNGFTDSTSKVSPLPIGNPNLIPTPVPTNS